MQPDLDVYYVDLQIFVSSKLRLNACLSIDEVSRAARFKFPDDRSRFVMTRGALRHILGSYLQISPAEILFQYGQLGKPALAMRHGGVLQFNVSHTKKLAVIAVTTCTDVGVDIESLTRITDHDGLVSRYFCPTEIVTFRELDACSRPIAFLNAWARKEAYLKAIGQGVIKGLDQVCVTCKPGDPARFLDTEISNQWSLHELLPPMEHVGALVYQGNNRAVKTIEWTIA